MEHNEAPAATIAWHIGLLQSTPIDRFINDEIDELRKELYKHGLREGDAEYEHQLNELHEEVRREKEAHDRGFRIGELHDIYGQPPHHTQDAEPHGPNSHKKRNTDVTMTSPSTEKKKARTHDDTEQDSRAKEEARWPQRHENWMKQTRHQRREDDGLNWLQRHREQGDEMMREEQEKQANETTTTCSAPEKSTHTTAADSRPKIRPIDDASQRAANQRLDMSGHSLKPPPSGTSHAMQPAEETRRRVRTISDESSSTEEITTPKSPSTRPPTAHHPEEAGEAYSTGAIATRYRNWKATRSAEQTTSTTTPSSSMGIETSDPEKLLPTDIQATQPNDKPQRLAGEGKRGGPFLPSDRLPKRSRLT